jgi:type II secretory pathway pseudopilin PulG
MPIAYTCPHCGKQYSVAEQYAGQSGPCAACGKPITVPMLGPGAYGPAPASNRGGGGVVAVIIAVVILFLACPGVLIALLLPAVQMSREAARRAQSSNNLRQLGIAIHNYHDVHNAFPPAVVKDANGKPLYSGRVLLLPYLEQQSLYNAWALDEAWDSPRNLPLSQTAIRTFQDPSNPTHSPGETDYLFVTGTGTMFEDTGRRMSFGDIQDGTSNTIMMVEAKGQGINWAEPRDIDMSMPVPLPASSHPAGNLILFGDGSVRTVPKNLPPATVHAAATRSGGEPVSLP